MSKRRYYLDARVLTIFFFVAMPFVAFGSFLVVSMARSALTESLGASFEQRAVETRLLLERYVADQIIQLRLACLDPQLRVALSAAARERTPDEAKRLEQAWVSGDDAKLLASILASPLASRLREMVQVRPALKLLEVVDGRGRLVAASGRAGRLTHAEAPWFKALVAESAERPYVGDIQRVAGANLGLLEIAYPIYDNEARLLGAMRGLLDASDLYSVIAPVRIGRTGHADVIRSTDGMVLASDESDRVLTQLFPGFHQIQAAIEHKRGYWTIREIRPPSAEGEARVAPARIVGFNQVEQVPNVKWLVVVEQELAEAAAPVQQVTRFLWIHFIGAFGTVILLALYFSFKLETPVIEEELHLHEEHLPASMRGAGGGES